MESEPLLASLGVKLHRESAKEKLAGNLNMSSHPKYHHHNKNGLVLHKSVFVMVETVGIEPMTSCMSSMRSNQLSYASATDDIIAHTFGIVNRFLKSFLKKFAVSCAENGGGSQCENRRGVIHSAVAK